MHIQKVFLTSVCMCVCVRERERERELSPTMVLCRGLAVFLLWSTTCPR